MRYAFSLILALFLLCPQSEVYAASGMRVRAEVDKNVINLDELLTYKLTVVSIHKNVNIDTPDFIDFSTLSREESVSYQQNGKLTIRVLVYVLAPMRTGKIVIDRARIAFNDKEFFSRGFKIKVLDVGVPKPGDPVPDQEEPVPQEEPFPQEDLFPQEKPVPEMPISSEPQYNL